MLTNKRTAREIKISDKLLHNNKINVKIGTIENREAPETIYIFMSFWLEPKEEYKTKDQNYLKDILNRELSKIFSKKLKKELENNIFFPKEKENIFIKNIPENLNYNSKKNFISIELYLHTCNILNEEKMPLSIKRNTKLFQESLKVANLMGDSEVLIENTFFNIQKKSN